VILDVNDYFAPLYRHFKASYDSDGLRTVVSKASYVFVGFDVEGRNHVLGTWIRGRRKGAETTPLRLSGLR
jgi:hypothetical protein